MENQPSISNMEKKAAVESMFDSIAWRYDFLNHFFHLISTGSGDEEPSE